MAATNSLLWFHKPHNLEKEFRDLKKEKEIATSGVLHLLKEPHLREFLTVSVVMMLVQQLTGINAVIFYSTKLFREAGLDSTDAQDATIWLGITNFTMTLVAVFVMERFGRKALLHFGIRTMLASTMILFFCLMLLKYLPFDDFRNDAGAKGIQGALVTVSIISLIIFIIGFAIGPGPIPWFLVSELFPPQFRASVASVSVTVSWFANFVVSLSFYPVEAIIGPYVFLFFAIVMLFSDLYIKFEVPEI